MCALVSYRGDVQAAVICHHTQGAPGELGGRDRRVFRSGREPCGVYSSVYLSKPDGPLEMYEVCSLVNCSLVKRVCAKIHHAFCVWASQHSVTCLAQSSGRRPLPHRLAVRRLNNPSCAAKGFTWLMQVRNGIDIMDREPDVWKARVLMLAAAYPDVNWSQARYILSYTPA